MQRKGFTHMKIVTTSELKAHLARVMAQLESASAPVYVTQHGKPKAVLVKYEEYEALQEKLEDLEDALAMQQAMASSQEEAVSLDEYERRRAAQVRC
jgi:prevent-host-death family protein